MKRLSRFTLLGVLTLLAFPLAAQGQTNVKVSGMTNLFTSNRTPATTNSDLAFWGNLAFTGDYDGFRVFDITNPTAPALLATVTCTTEPGLSRAGQGDISVWRNLVFRSVDTAQTSPDCATRRRTAAAATTAPAGFEGIDIFDVSNPRAPREVAHVATDCGSHTHTLVPDLARNRVLLYISSYPAAYLSSTPTPWGNTCERLTPTGAQGHDKISIVEVPLAAPQTARVIAEPQFNLAGPGFQGIPGYKGCHDITAHMRLRIAAGACLTEGVIFDISNPAAPTIKQRLVNPAIDSCARAVPNPPVEPLCLWHSSTFTWDGRYMVFGDEDGGGGTPECSTEDPSTDGAFWLHRVATPTSPIAHFKIPRVQFDRPAGDPLLDETCTAHIMNFVPINGRYILPSSWYFGGTSVVNWTNLTAPTEMAYFEVDQSTTAGAAPYTDTWTTYWYNDYIHANDINRGYETFRLDVPWRSLAWNLRRFNPQTQEDLASCTVRATGMQLRARRASHVAISVRTRNGVALIGGQPISQAHVMLRGAGISRMVMTNASGMAHVRVRPTRRGILRVAVQSDENLLGCRTQRSVAAAAGAGGRLTGSR